MKLIYLFVSLIKSIAGPMKLRLDSIGPSELCNITIIVVIEVAVE